jgi:biotin operon repressor
MVFSKQVTRDDYYVVYLSILNGLLHLTEKELLVMAEFMGIEEKARKVYSTLSGEEFSDVLFGPESRKAVQKKLGITKFNLNNYIKALKDKGLLKEIDGRLYISAALLPERGGNVTKVEFKLVETDGTR